MPIVAICTGRVEAKACAVIGWSSQIMLQSARGVWRQTICYRELKRVNKLQSARGVWRQSSSFSAAGAITELQSARGVWRQRKDGICIVFSFRCNLHGACGGKASELLSALATRCCNLHGACGGKALPRAWAHHARVAICTGRVEAKVLRHKFRTQVCGVAICTGRVEAKLPRRSPAA